MEGERFDSETGTSTSLCFSIDLTGKGKGIRKEDGKKASKIDNVLDVVRNLEYPVGVEEDKKH